MRVAVILKCLNQQQTRMSKVLQYIVLSAYARQNVSFCFFFFVAVCPSAGTPGGSASPY